MDQQEPDKVAADSGQASALRAVAAAAVVGCALLVLVAIFAHRRAQHTAARTAPLQLDPAEFRDKPRPFGPGEEATYRLSWNGVPCGTAEIRLEQEEREGASWLVVRYTVKPTATVDWALDYRTEGKSYLDPVTLLPSYSVRQSERRGRRRIYTTTFDRDTGQALVTKEKPYRGASSSETVPITLGLDWPAVYLVLRVLEPPAGRAITFEAVNEDKRSAVEVVAEGGGTVQVEAGRYDVTRLAVRVRKVRPDEGDSEGSRSWTVCISREGRVPVLIEGTAAAGKVRVELTHLKKR